MRVKTIRKRREFDERRSGDQRTEPERKDRGVDGESLHATAAQRVSIPNGSRAEAVGATLMGALANDEAAGVQVTSSRRRAAATVYSDDASDQAPMPADSSNQPWFTPPAAQSRRLVVTSTACVPAVAGDTTRSAAARASRPYGCTPLPP
jgi:hypothetical protein